MDWLHSVDSALFRFINLRLSNPVFDGLMPHLANHPLFIPAVLLLAALIAFSRVYLGVHYPSDVFGGAILGAGYAAAMLCLLEAVWRSAGPRWFQPWFQRLPSLIRPELRPTPSDSPAASAPGSVVGVWMGLAFLSKYFLSSDRPKNQFFFWLQYRYRKTRRGQNALFVEETATPDPPPKELTAEFDSVRDLGLREIKYRGRVFRRIQIFECRGLK